MTSQETLVFDTQINRSSGTCIRLTSFKVVPNSANLQIINGSFSFGMTNLNFFLDALASLKTMLDNVQWTFSDSSANIILWRGEIWNLA